MAAAVARTLALAKARLSEAVNCATAQGPQIITRNRKPAAVLVSPEDWERTTARRGSLAGFLMASPLRSPEIELERVPTRPRALDL